MSRHLSINLAVDRLGKMSGNLVGSKVAMVIEINLLSYIYDLGMTTHINTHKKHV